MATMTAIVHDAYGTVPEDVLRLQEMDKPTIANEQVLVRVHAASVERGTWHIMAGLPYPIRVAGFGLRKPKYLNPGRSLAGTIEAVGNNVTGFQPGDAVFGICDSSFAEYVGIRTDKLAPKPSNLSFGEAAAVPISGITALQAVRDHGAMEDGQNVLIVGASGGVGSFAVQITKAFGADVTGVCSTAKVDLVRALGADHVIDYSREDFAGGVHDVADQTAVRRSVDVERVQRKIWAVPVSGHPVGQQAAERRIGNSGRLDVAGGTVRSC
jgi:NADPH:quinone reductase-like Zn-dependent oxidoreductase